MLDLVISNVRIARREGCFDVGLKDGRIAAIEHDLTADAPRHDMCGCFAFGGFVDSHIHLDKACILDRCFICEGTLEEAVRETAKAKAAFTVEDVYARTARVVENAIVNGTTAMRTFVEIDPRAGFRSFEAIKQIKRSYAWAIDIQICAFAQEGLTNETETEAMLDHALRDGADLVGGCPYTDPDPRRHIGRIFDLAERHDVDVDFHLDFDLNPSGSAIPAVLAETKRRGYGGRVSIGHATKLAAMPASEAGEIAARLADAGIAVTVLPATDLFLLGRDRDHLIPRGLAPAMLLTANGVNVTVATNNVLNPFTPFGDASLARMANFFANTAQLSRNEDIAAAFDMVTANAARMMRRDYDLKPGAQADIVVADAADPLSLVREIRQPIAGWKNGRQTFMRPRARLLSPEN
ncbi:MULTISPECIES: amidohydrolase family protein [unclassified Rhizobium]|uniref:amidohydrolase family protein n=1 Tax=unclassified Rhizobium TaxID=2613769 RepID=UPI000EA85CFC|nr:MULTISPECIES: amidohydrolase family protein [unclassified Rhizobium]AYG68873.1 amidohydrolase [Rhizobium sp. CCGE531]AYG75260.1 amidohydrolase [Rhizobium sp. CCGE532]